MMRLSAPAWLIHTYMHTASKYQTQYLIEISYWPILAPHSQVDYDVFILELIICFLS